MKKIGVLGAGTWGIALARMLCNIGNDITVWSAVDKEIDALVKTYEQPNLKGIKLPQEIKFTKDIKDAVEGMDIILFAVASPYVRATAHRIADLVSDNQIIVDVAKGIESDTLYTMSMIIKDEIKNDNVKVVALSGPTHAEEVALDMPTTIVSACEDEETAKKVQDIFMNTCMRVYTNTDILGVELCGALKNIIALAAGISDGMGYGDNAKAAIITRGIAEMVRLGIAMGCSPQTFSGLAGLGDLIVTATSRHSRNNKAGNLIGQGYSVDEAIEKVGMVVEGINAIPAAEALANKYDVEMPIIHSVYEAVEGNVSPKEAMLSLMTRKKKDETVIQ